MTRSFHRAARCSDIPEGKPIGLIVNRWPVLLGRSGGDVHAVIDRCSHAASELSTGRIQRGALMCPLHGARFDLATGACIGASYEPLMTFELRARDGWIDVAVPDDPPGFQHMPLRRTA